tara:strand:+ start:515 stop:1639 length:1125 start_codon:yes stop_codon:yes gene_type:complete
MNDLIKKKKNKTAFITGITGQDGSYLAEFLLKKGYIVHGLKRRTSQFNTKLIDHIYESPYQKNRKFYLHYGDLTDSLSLNSIIERIKPDEIYNLAAQSHVAVSFENPVYTSEVNAIGTLSILESIRSLGLVKKTKFYQASSSEMYGKTLSKLQNEKTIFNPRSPYAISKIFAYWITINYRMAYKIFACNGILFNHESSRRGETFITKKITKSLSNISFGIEKCIQVGNLDAKRDWGHAKDYVEMQWKILQQKKPDDFVIATGQQLSVRDFITKCANYLKIKIRWQGERLNEKAIVLSSNKNITPSIKKGDTIVKVNKRYYRPSEVESLCGDSKKAQKILKWKPKYNIEKLIREMVDFDYNESKKQNMIKKKLGI